MSEVRFEGRATPWTVAHQAPLSMEFSRQEYWCGLPFPSSEDVPNSGIKLGSSALQVNSLPSEPPGKPLYAYATIYISTVSLLSICFVFLIKNNAAKNIVVCVSGYICAKGLLRI